MEEELREMREAFPDIEKAMDSIIDIVGELDVVTAYKVLLLTNLYFLFTVVHSKPEEVSEELLDKVTTNFNNLTAKYLVSSKKMLQYIVKDKIWETPESTLDKVH